MTIPAQVEKMLSAPGVYLVSPKNGKVFTVVLVDKNGVVQQMTIDGLLTNTGWHPDVVIRGPLSVEDEPLTG